MLITLLPYYYWWYSIDVCVYRFKCLLPYYLITIGGIVEMCVHIISLNAYYLITVLPYCYWWYSIDVCISF